MSMKFFSGLQDLLGLYDATVPSTQSPSSHIPPSNGLFVPPITNPLRKKSASEFNSSKEDDAGQVQKCSHDRYVRFPGDNLVSGYSEAPTSPFHCEGTEEGGQGTSTSASPPDIEEILASYRRACQRAGIPTIMSVEKQIGYLHRAPSVRQECLSLKGERVTHAQMEALEEIFRRVQFDSLDFEYTFLDDDSAISLGEMLEFYDSTHKLNLSFNKQITIRGWTEIFKAIRNCCSLQVVNLRYTSLSDKSLSALCRILRGHPQPALGCLHLENVNLSGKNLYMLVCALKTNTTLKELYLGENNLQSTDGAHLHQLISCNTSIQMLDLRNNQLTDNGVRKMCEALVNPDVCKKSALSAIVLWNTKITGACMDSLAQALHENHRLETLNIGSNNLGVVGMQNLRHALCGGSNLHRLGLQNTQMTCESAIILAECLADNSAMVRVDLRDNPSIGSAGLLALHSAMKMNTSITLMNLDQSCALANNAKVRPYQDEFRRYFDEIKQYCERNKILVLRKITAHAGEIKEAEDKDNVISQKEERGKSDGDLSPSSCQPPQIDHEKNSARKSKFMRSSSLTCAETVTDIHERIRVMSGSTHSLDETNSDSTKTIRKFTVTRHSPLGKAEWGSLPALSQAPSTAESVIRKTRRFSVSPSSSTFDVTESSAEPHTPMSRPCTLAIGIPSANDVLGRTGPLSAPMFSSLPNSLNLWSTETSLVDETSASDQSNVYDEETIETTDFLRTNKKGVENADIEQGVRNVINDLVNYIVYEETSKVERKASLLLHTATYTPSERGLQLVPFPVEKTHIPLSLTTPSRIINVVEEMSEESDEMVISDIIRYLIREVLRKEKSELQNTLNRRRNKLRGGPSPSTPV